MIKIISLPSQETYKTTCYHCQCVFSYQTEDIKSKRNDNRPCSVVKCPNCKQTIIADGKLIKEKK